VISANSHENHTREEQAVENFVSMHVEGIIACLAQDTVDYKHFEVINEMGIPLVFYARTCMQDRFSCVTGNGDEAAQEATQHLIDTGSRRIAFLGGPNHLDMVQRRKHGYLEALRENKIAIDRSLVVSGKMDFAEAREAALRLLDREDRPDAILAVNDTVTFAVFDAIKTRHLRIPQDVAIIGFTENDASAFVTPKLTVIKDQAHQLGEKACELLLRRIKGDTRIYREIIPMTLEIRESSDKKKLL
jgi:LacI family transcriptional regulator